MKGHWLLNEAWKNNTFSYSEEKYILNNFNKKITRRNLILTE